jgi:RimJ/RimL family protein N-acetyltransferase
MNAQLRCRLIAVPFNALALRSLEAGGGRLWQQAQQLFAAEDAERRDPCQADAYLKDYFEERFDRRGWTLERIAAERSRFLNYETHHIRNDPDAPPYMQDSYFALLAHEPRIVGEFSLNYCHEIMEEVAGFDYLAPALRGQKFGTDLLMLRLKTAAQLGYDFYRAAVHENNPQSYSRLERLVESGKASKTKLTDGRSYHVDLRHFR